MHLCLENFQPPDGMEEDLIREINVMQNIFKNQLSNSMNNFLKLVIDKDRISAIENMKESYKSLLNDKNNILEGTAITAVELSEKEIKSNKDNYFIFKI